MDILLNIIVGILTLAVLSVAACRFIYSYPMSAHGPAFGKAFFLWLVSTSPVIGGILLSKPNPQGGPIPNQLHLEVLANFTITEMFVYTASFTAPVLYVVFDVVKQIQDEALKFQRKALEKYLRGMQYVVLTALMILLLTLLAYSSAKSDPAGFHLTYLALLLTGKGYIVYLASLLIWYCVVLWETTPKSDFEKEGKEEATDFSAGFKKRRQQ